MAEQAATAASNPVLRPLLKKTIGEFALLFSLIRENSSRAWHELRRVSQADAAASVARLTLDLDPSALGDCQLAHFIERGFGFPVLDLSFCLARIRSLPDDGTLSIEHAFVIESTGATISQMFCAKASLQFLAAATSHGLDRSSAYTLTHLAYFGTLFGRRVMPVPHVITHTLTQLARSTLRDAIADRNCDLVAETALAILLLDPNLRDSADLAAATRFMNASRSVEGWFLSDETTAQSSPQVDLASPWIHYSLFHTTCVAILFQLIHVARGRSRRIVRRRLAP